MSIIQGFHRVSLEDRDAVLKCLAHNPYRNCDYSFANLYSWGFIYSTEMTIHKGMLMVRFSNPLQERKCYLMPVGDGNLEEVLLDLQTDLKESGDEVMVLMSVTNDGLEILKALNPDQIKHFSNRDYCDYIYSREKLATLTGKKLQSKRNHINKFERSYPDWTYESITDENIQECIDLEGIWLEHTEEDEEKIRERSVVLTDLNHRKALGLTGGCIRVNNRIVAFTLGMPLTPDTFDVTIEKADTEYDGAFAIINREFAKRIPERYTYLNREEDLGSDGLRKSKLSYKPDFLLCKNTVFVSLDLGE